MVTVGRTDRRTHPRGWITDNYSWEWIFFINIPIGVFSSFWCGAAQGRPNACRSPQMDYIGLATLVLGVGAFADHARSRNDEDCSIPRAS